MFLISISHVAGDWGTRFIDTLRPGFRYDTLYDELKTLAKHQEESLLYDLKFFEKRYSTKVGPLLFP